MDALDVARVCVRRWWVIVPVLLLAWGASLGLAKQVKPEYSAFASYALLYKQTQPVKADAPNPLNSNPLAVDGGVLLGEAVAASLLSADTQAALGYGNRGSAPGQADTGSSYSVSIPQGAKAYFVQTWGGSPASVRATVDAVLAAAPGRAQQIQSRAGAPDGSQLTAFVTAPTQVIELPPQSKVKILLPVLGVGLMAGAALSLIVDRLLSRRASTLARQHLLARHRRDRRRLESVDDEDGEPDPAQHPAAGTEMAAEPDAAEPDTTGQPAAATEDVDLQPDTTIRAPRIRRRSRSTAGVPAGAPEMGESSEEPRLERGADVSVH